MTGTYLSKRHGDTYEVWYIDANGDRELIAVGTCDPKQIARRVADIEADHRRTLEQQEADG